MASGSNSPTSDSESDHSEMFELTDDEFQDWKLVIGLNAKAAGGDNWSDEELESDESTRAIEIKKMCIGGNNEGMCWGLCMERGLRKHMEDRIAVFPALMSLKCEGFGGCMAPDCEFASEESQISYFAVFDGHGGSEVSDSCADSLHLALKEAWGSEGCTNEWNNKWQSALTRAYESVDRACVKSFTCGSTAVVVLISPCQIVAANCGDSRAVLCRGSYTIPLTTDHKPYREDEKERIVKSGGHVIPDPLGVMRVDGVLAMTRAIGDKSMKPYVSAVPELTFTTRTDEDECLIIASDGLWDVMSSKLVGNMACRLLRHERKKSRINGSPTKYVAKYLFKEACSRSSTDNISVIVVDLKKQP